MPSIVGLAIKHEWYLTMKVHHRCIRWWTEYRWYALDQSMIKLHWAFSLCDNNPNSPVTTEKRNQLPSHEHRINCQQFEALLRPRLLFSVTAAESLYPHRSLFVSSMKILRHLLWFRKKDPHTTAIAGPVAALLTHLAQFSAVTASKRPARRPGVHCPDLGIVEGRHKLVQLIVCTMPML